MTNGDIYESLALVEFQLSLIAAGAEGDMGLFFITVHYMEQTGISMVIPKGAVRMFFWADLTPRSSGICGCFKCNTKPLSLLRSRQSSSVLPLRM